MAGLFASLFKRKRQASPRVPTDEVIAVHLFDDGSMTRSIIMGMTLRFNDALDCDMAHDALARLLEMGDWKKLGGRLRLTNKGKLEIHIPQKFTPERPAVRYTHVSYDVDMDEHVLASRLPRATPGPSLQTGSTEYRTLIGPPDDVWHDVAVTIQDFIYTDRPQLGLHAVSFRDATLLTLSWPHTLFDAGGGQALFRNWSLVMAGKEDKVQPLLGARDDITDKITKPDTTVGLPKLAARKLGGAAMLLFIVRFMWALLFGPKMIRKLVFLPASTVAALKEEATEYLQNSHPRPSVPFVSTSDTLIAWSARMAVADLPPTSTQPVTIMSIFETRSRLPSIIDPGAGVYVQNMVIPSWAFTDVSSLMANPLGCTAAHIRAALQEQTTEDQVRAAYRFLKPAQIARKPTLYGSPRAELIPVSNWTKANFFEVVDFSPALLSQGQKKRFGDDRDKFPETAAGKPVFFAAVSFSRNPELRNVVNILGKDAAGNYWLQMDCRPKVFENIEKEFARMRAAKGGEGSAT
ncbi:hypothetical protein B0H66DRAFT_640916 [Apodospora peruviana]|uniref:Uncharacterized protein n=1 Tax=Apodospora peruviana TaxID=516989 RepID=A0AAE0I038_9PEZI|nr:hypothetical protein B0H66DRAFT_640916 [Apodospora peruviana]